jgi:hypothetical protein
LAGHPAAVAAVAEALADLKTGRAAVDRPCRMARWRRGPAELVTVTLAGRPGSVTALARAIANVVAVAGMRHHVDDGPGATGPPNVRLQMTCYPPRRLDRK